MSDFPPRMNPLVAKHMSVFMPHALERLKEIDKNGTRFVHYTAAETGLKIITTKTVWMRQTACMNDFSEVDHGLTCLTKAWHGEHGKRLQALLDGRFPGIVKEISDYFDAFRHALVFDTYVTSLSEHAPTPEHIDEDKYGRLSMWRAYGAGGGVALVMKQEPFWSNTDALGIYSTPVGYFDDARFEREFKTVVDNVEANGEHLAQIGKDWTKHSVVMAFTAAAVGTKHPGFKEEREWRIVRAPTFPVACPFEKTTVSIQGVPQPVLLLPLKDQPPALVGATPAELLDRVIIGPTAYPLAVRESYIRALTEVGVKDPESRVINSFVPLRT